jgi:NAD(P)H-flavin reductase
MRASTSGAELQFLLEDVGPGTNRLCELARGDELLLVGPLGVGFAPPGESLRPVLVGGGVGIAPLAIWQDQLGLSTTVLLGFRDALHAPGATLLSGARVATDDGSVGHPGLVTELLTAELDRDPAAEVYACGPPAMLEAVRALCAQRETPAQLALESGMACGFGACFGCVVPTRRGYLRVCVDGPVIRASELETALVAGAGH